MKNLLSFVFILGVVFVFTSCDKKDEGPVGPEIQFFLDLQLGKQYNFQRWTLDTLNRRTQETFQFSERCIAKNVSIGGVNDAIATETFYSTYDKDTSYLRVVNGKDVYELVDTSGMFLEPAIANFETALRKLSAQYVWLPRILLSRGNLAEYVILPKRYYPIQIDTNLIVTVSFEMKGKNEGFENITIPAGNFKTYKVKITISAEIFAYGQKLDNFDFIQFYWISDDLDWWIKQYQPTVKSRLFGVIERGFDIELLSYH